MLICLSIVVVAALVFLMLDVCSFFYRERPYGLVIVVDYESLFIKDEDIDDFLKQWKLESIREQSQNIILYEGEFVLGLRRREAKKRLTVIEFSNAYHYRVRNPRKILIARNNDLYHQTRAIIEEQKRKFRELMENSPHRESCSCISSLFGGSGIF